VEKETMSTGLASDLKMAAKRNDAPVKVDVVVLAKARIAAATKGISLAEYASEAIEAAADRDIAAFKAEGKTPAKPKGSK
jgi:hypothetical protein